MNFLQKGLAGLESRLDKVLLDEPDRLEQQAKREPVSELLRNGEGRRSVEKGMYATYLALPYFDAREPSLLSEPMEIAQLVDTDTGRCKTSSDIHPAGASPANEHEFP